MRKITNTFILMLIGLVGVPGCSQDIHVFKSTADKPITVAVVDPVRDVTVWEMDIPVAHKVKIDLDRQPEFEPIYTDLRPPRFLSWRVYHEKGGNAIESDRIKLPGTPVLLQLSYRPSGELPPPGETVSPVEPNPLPDRSPDVTSQSPGAATSEPATSEPATSEPVASEPVASEPATSEAVAAETVPETEEATTDPSPEASDANPEDNEEDGGVAVPLPGLE